MSRSLAEDLAPGAASADWSSSAWVELPGAVAPADLVRLGTIQVGAPQPAGHERAGIPALAPLGPGEGWIITGHPADGRELLFQTVLRLVAQSPLPNIVVESFDPRTSAALAPLAPLRSLQATSVPGAAVDADSFVRRLKTVAGGSSLNAEQVVSGGARSLTELWRAQRSPEGTLTIVTVIGYPYGVTPRAAPDDPPSRRTRPVGGRDRARAGRRRSSHRPNPRCGRPIFAPSCVRSPSTTGECARTVFPRLRTTRSPRVNWWHRSSPVSRNRCRTIRVHRSRCQSSAEPTSPPHGRSPPSTASTPQSDRSATERSRCRSAPPIPRIPNMLAGGMVGSGKSTLLLDVIYSSPWAIARKS